jgi:hypothetical protein
MSITPLPPLLEPGDVRTWVTSQWKSPGRPGQFSAEINTPHSNRQEVVQFFLHVMLAEQDQKA